MARSVIDQHPDEYREDLNPEYGAGQNEGPVEYECRTAYEIKELHAVLRELRDDELKRVPVLVEGSRLEQGATYIDLRHPEAGEFKALGGMVAGTDNWYVPKSAMDYELWNLLTGIGNTDRLGLLAPSGVSGPIM